MNAIIYTYQGEAVRLIPNKETDLIQIGDRFVRVSKICAVKEKRAKKWPKLYIVKFAPSPR